MANFGLPSIISSLLGVGALKTYDFRNFLVTVAGQPIAGYAEDDGFEIEWIGAGFQPVFGLDGEISRKYDNVRAAHVFLNLSQTADANAVLTGLYLYDFDGAGRVNTTCFPVSIVSVVPNGGTYQSNDCWIEKPPTVTGGKDAGSIRWPLFCPDMPPLIS
jgi:hypothetical protein